MKRRLLAILIVALPAACGDDDGTPNTNQQNNANQTQPVCGNGVLETGEQCDDGAANDDTAPDACRTSCRTAYCGDGVVDGGETCDSGVSNGVSPSVCKSDCTPTTCGDGYVGGLEVCDDGNNDEGDGCSGNCGQDLTTCGNNVREPWEACDHGDQNSDVEPGACRTSCQLPRCGDGVVDPGEACDDGNNDDDLVCSANCASYCGDGVLNVFLGETCDAGADNGVEPSGCMTGCVRTTCGDGYVGGTEVCDDGAGNSDVAANACRTTCVPASCGDGVVDAGEACDAGAANSDVVANACRTDCTAARCGDSVVDAGEACDGANLAGETCEGRGFGGGVLSCTAGCALDTSACEGWVQLAAGDRFTCGVRADGTVRCWGDGRNGALGHGSLESSAVPVEVVGLTQAVEVVGGMARACARRDDGTVWCWGQNDFGALGNGTSDWGSLVPVQVSGLTDATRIVSGQAHACAIRGNGTVACWGMNSSGQLGIGAATGGSTVPVQALGVTGVTVLGAGAAYTCAASPTGTWCWGLNRAGTVGDGTIDNRMSPTLLPGLTGVVGFLSGPRNEHTCAVLDSGELHCWGNNDVGQLGLGFRPSHELSPRWVESLGDVVSGAAGGISSCAVTGAGQVYCWGSNGDGQLGLGHQQGVETPVPLAGVTGVRSLVAGEAHACAVGEDRAAYCWGSNNHGQLGSRVPRQSLAAIPVPGLANASRITAATYHTCTLEGTVGAAYCWGANVRGQLGNGTIEPRLSPAGVLGLVGAWDLSAGSMHTCAAMGPAGVSCWGQNANHQLGDDGTMLRLVPGVVLGSLGTVYQVSAGEAHTCAVRDGDKTVWCWGWNSAGQLGDGTQVERGLPVRAGTLTGVVEVAAGSEYSCARTSTAVHCWGLNYHGALGDGSTTNRLSPVAVSLPGIPTSLAVGWQHTCAGLDDGTLWCWGLNFYAQLGDGTQGNSAAPVPVLLDADSATPLDDVVDVSVNWGATCALRGDGTVWCWGDNRENNLGLGPVASHMVPSPMLGITGATQVAMGSAHTCVLGPAGTVWCAGANPSGQLGNGERTASLVPVIVPE